MAKVSIAKLRKELDKVKTKSAWNKGLVKYAHMMLDDVQERWDYEGKTTIDTANLHNELLPFNPRDSESENSFGDWKQASKGGSYLINDKAIAETLSSPSELKKTKNGELNPNKNEDWLDVQGRALYQAEMLINRLAQKMQSGSNTPKTSKTKLPSNAQLSNRAFK